MIERKVIDDKLRQVLVEDLLSKELDKVGYSGTHIHKTPLGEKIIIRASRPGLVVGSKGSNVKRLTRILKTRFKFENPQIEIEEIKDPRLDARLVAENIASSMERFGAGRFKGQGYRAIEDSISAGALGVEILITGKIPSSRARRWRFYKGYIKKCGDVAFNGVLTAYYTAKLKSGVVGIQVRIMPPDLVLPDKIVMGSELVTEESVTEVSDKDAEAEVEEVAKASEKTESKESAKKESKEEVKTEAAPEEKPVEAKQ